MKKINLTATAAGVLAFGGIVLANTDSTDGSTEGKANSKGTDTVQASAEKQNSGELIGFEEASAIALANADGQVTDIELSEDDGRQQYEVDIRDAEYEYDFEIDANTGKVLEQDRDRLRDDDRISSTENAIKDDGQKPDQNDKQKNESAAQDLISMSEAEEIALKETGGGKVMEFDLEHDDGRHSYDFEIVNGQTEFELEIDAVNGKVLEFEQDDDNR